MKHSDKKYNLRSEALETFLACACQYILLFFFVFECFPFYLSLLFKSVDHSSKSCLELDSQQSFHQMLMKCFSHSADVLLQGTCSSVNIHRQLSHMPVHSHRDVHIHTDRAGQTALNLLSTRRQWVFVSFSLLSHFRQVYFIKTWSLEDIIGNEQSVWVSLVFEKLKHLKFWKERVGSSLRLHINEVF